MACTPERMAPVKAREAAMRERIADGKREKDVESGGISGPVSCFNMTSGVGQG